MIRVVRPPRALAALATLLALLAGCTGTEERRDPVLLVVASDDRVGLVEDRTGPERTLAPLPAGQHVFPGAQVLDLGVARRAGPDETDVHVHVLYREGGEDALQAFDATFVPTDEADRFAPVGDPVPLSAIVADAGVLAGEPLGSRAIDVDPTGRWLGLLHDGTACAAAEGTTATLLLDLDAGEVAEPSVASLPTVADVAPVFGGDGDYLWWLEEETGRVTARAYPAAASSSAAPRRTLEVEDPSGFGRAGNGWLVVAEGDAIVAFDPGGDELVPQASERPVERVVDAEVLGVPAAVLLAGDRIVVHRDVAAESDPDVVEEPVSGGALDATIHPDRFAYVLTETGTIRVFDLLPMLDEANDWRPAVATAAPDPVEDPVAIEWIHGVAPEGASAGLRRR